MTPGGGPGPGSLRLMRIAIAGAHGKIGLRLVQILAARGDEVVGLIRNRDHASDVAAAGAQPVVCDLERASASQVSSVGATGAQALQRTGPLGAGAPPGSWGGGAELIVTG